MRSSPFSEVEERIRIYERQYGSYGKFLGQYDCGSSRFEESVVLMDWESLLEEEQRRHGRSEPCC
jgi:hypothetical protein